MARKESQGRSMYRAAWAHTTTPTITSKITGFTVKKKKTREGGVGPLGKDFGKEGVTKEGTSRAPSKAIRPRPPLALKTASPAKAEKKKMKNSRQGTITSVSQRYGTKLEEEQAPKQKEERSIYT